MIKLGWVEIYKGTSMNDYQRIEEKLRVNMIRYRGYEFNHSNRSAAVAIQYAPQSVQRGPAFNPSAAYIEYAEKNEPTIYSLEIKRRDLNRYHTSHTV